MLAVATLSSSVLPFLQMEDHTGLSQDSDGENDMEKFTRINHPNILQNEVVKVDFQLPDSDS